jgi:hypothetical protein
MYWMVVGWLTISTILWTLTHSTMLTSQGLGSHDLGDPAVLDTHIHDDCAALKSIMISHHQNTMAFRLQPELPSVHSHPRPLSVTLPSLCSLIT